MSQIVDARGLPCPQPVILTRQALLQHDDVVCIVDNETAQHNVTRMAAKMGLTPNVAAQDDGITRAAESRFPVGPVDIQDQPRVEKKIAIKGVNVAF